MQQPSFYCKGILKLTPKQGKLINVLGDYAEK
jgi:hypothetical protein